MCYAGGCHPDCDSCKPKYLSCPECGARNYLVRNSCIKCGYAITEDDRQSAKEAWRATHKGKAD